MFSVRLWQLIHHARTLLTAPRHVELIHWDGQGWTPLDDEDGTEGDDADNEAL